MTRVEWSVLEGGQAETLLANLIYNLDGRSIRVRPSQGDYGIDIIRPADGHPERWNVYQIKKFAQNLTAGQKIQIVDSFARALVGMLRRGVPLNDWYVVLPLDPTLENYLDWLKTVPDAAVSKLKKDTKLVPRLLAEEEAAIAAWRFASGRVIGWKGLDFCEGLAADYPYVIDYYLHGGAQRIKDAVAEMAKMLQTDVQLRAQDSEAKLDEGSAALMQPAELREHLGRLGRVLDTDPHFRYGVAIDPAQPQLHLEPDLIAATQERVPGDLWLTFKIYARSAQSLDERPVPIKMNFEFDQAGSNLQAYKDWQKYGKPYEGNASFEADLPGGLHPGGKSGRVRISLAEGEASHFRNRQRVVAPDGTVLAELGFTVSATTGMDRTGSWASGIDDSGVLTSESLLDETEQRGRINFTLAPLAGHEASKVLPVATFASCLAAPNRLQVASEYGQFHDYSPLPEGLEPLVPPAMVRLIQALATVQTRTSKPVLVPDFLGFTQDEIQDIRSAAALIAGKTIVRTWTEVTIGNDPAADLQPGMHLEIRAGCDLKLPKITGDELLGLVQQQISSATIASVDGDQVRCVPFMEDTMYVTLVEASPDASLRQEAGSG